MTKVMMPVPFDSSLVEQASAQGIDVAEAAEAGLRRALAEGAAAERARRWAEENAEAVRVHNERVAARGLFGEDLRRW